MLEIYHFGVNTIVIVLFLSILYFLGYEITWKYITMIIIGVYSFGNLIDIDHMNGGGIPQMISCAMVVNENDVSKSCRDLNRSEFHTSVVPIALVLFILVWYIHMVMDYGIWWLK